MLGAARKRRDCARPGINNTLNEQGDKACLWYHITHMGERLLETSTSAGSLSSAETTLRPDIGLRDAFRSMLAIPFLREGRKFQALWMDGRHERHLSGFSDKT